MATTPATAAAAAAAVPGPRRARRACSGVVAYARARASSPSRSWSRSWYAVLGGFKTNGQLVGRPGRDPARTLGARRTTPTCCSATNAGDLLAASAATASIDRASSRSVVDRRLRVARGVRRSRGCAFRGREALYTLFVFGLLFPSAVAILPLYILVRDLGLTGNLLGVALPAGRVRAARSRSSSCARSSGASPRSSRTRRGSTAAARSASSGGSCCRWPGRRSRPSACSRSSTPGTRSCCRWSSSTARTSGRCRSGS